MKEIKNVFSSADLELITGVKAHTIRMWEKRYDLFSPLKTARNIRHYNLEETKRMLNVSLLNSQGIKISKIAQMSWEDIEVKAREFVDHEHFEDAAIKNLKMAMYQFDTVLFESTYNQLLVKNSFETIFTKVFMPFLNFVGLLWQTSAIKPSHEHFISNLIGQKVLVQTEKESGVISQSEVFVLFLLQGEVHELGLLYINYLLKKNGYKTIYLGRSIPEDDLFSLKSIYPEADWVTYFTLNIESHKIQNYLDLIENEGKRKLFGFGRLPNFNHKAFVGVNEFKDFLNKLAKSI